MSRMKRSCEPASGMKCTVCGIADASVMRWFYPDALPQDSWYGKEDYHHDDTDCFSALLMENRKMRGDLEYLVDKVLSTVMAWHQPTKTTETRIVHHQCGWCGDVTVHECKDRKREQRP